MSQLCCQFCKTPFQRATAKFCNSCGARRSAGGSSDPAPTVGGKTAVTAVRKQPPFSSSSSSSSSAAPKTVPSLAATAKLPASSSATATAPNKALAKSAAAALPPRPSTAKSPARTPISNNNTKGFSPAATTKAPGAAAVEKDPLASTASPVLLSNTTAPSSSPSLSPPCDAADATSSGPKTIVGRPESPSSASSTTVDFAANSGDYSLVKQHLTACGLENLLGRFMERNINDESMPFVEEEDLTPFIGVAQQRRKLLSMFVPRNSTSSPTTMEKQNSGSVGGGQQGTTLALQGPMATVQAGEQALSPEVLETANADLLRNWRRGSCLGRGAFGACYLGLCPAENKFYAVKTIPINLNDPTKPEAGMRARDIIKISREIAMMRRVNHENCCRFFGCCYADGEICLFLELVTGGALGGVAAKFRPLPPSIIKNWTRQLFTGVAHLHSLSVAHRDLKSANVLLQFNGADSEARLKLADFGAAKKLSDEFSKASTVAGSPYWLAPEILTQTTGYDPFKADVYSAGITICEMLVGRPPWPEFSNAAQAILKICSHDGDLPSDFPAVGESGMTAELHEFLAKCLNKDPSKRPTAAEALQDPFFTD